MRLSRLSFLRLHPLEFEHREKYIYKYVGATVRKCPPLENYMIVIVIYTQTHTHLYSICNVVSCIVRSWIDCLRVQVMRACYRRSTFQRQPNDQPKYNKEKYTNTHTKKKKKETAEKSTTQSINTHSK